MKTYIKQKLIAAAVSVKVWGLLASLAMLMWGAITGVIALLADFWQGKSLPDRLLLLETIRAPGLITGGEFVAVWAIIFGIREVYKTENFRILSRRIASKIVERGKADEKQTHCGDFGGRPGGLHVELDKRSPKMARRKNKT